MNPRTPTPSEGPGERTTCPTCGHPREVVTSDEGTSYFKPPAQTEGPGEARGDLAEQMNRLANQEADRENLCNDDVILLFQAATELARVHRSAGEQGALRDGDREWLTDRLAYYSSLNPSPEIDRAMAVLSRVLAAVPAPITQPEEGE